MAKTFDSMLAGVQQPVFAFKSMTATSAFGNMLSTTEWYPGCPGAATVPSPGLAGEALTAWDGRIQIPAAVSGTRRLVGVSACFGQAGGTYFLADRLWQNSGIVLTTTTAQSFGTPVAIPARDADGTTDGRGVLAAMLVSGAALNANPGAVATISYTNSAGTGGRTGTLTNGTWTLSAPLGSMAIFNLQSGDEGVRSIESATLTASHGTTGALHFVLFRPLWMHTEFDIAKGVSHDPVTTGAPVIYANTNFWLYRHNYTTTQHDFNIMLTLAEADES